MKHKKTGRKFSREKKQREAMLKIMLGDLLVKRKMTTTLAKAKELSVAAEKIINRAKNPQAFKSIKSKLPKNINSKILGEVVLMTGSKKSGYLRIIKKGPRHSDSAKMAIIEIIDNRKTPVKEKV